jgi:CheY-like chemotaxis protein
MDEGYWVLRAMDGREAIKVVEEHRPDCVVLDINLPVMNGLDALSKILDAQPGLPVIINTAYAFVVKSSNLTELRSPREE